MQVHVDDRGWRVILKGNDGYFYGQYHSTMEVAAVWAGALGFCGLLGGTVVGAIAPGQRWERVLPARVHRHIDGAVQVGWNLTL